MKFEHPLAKRAQTSPKSTVMRRGIPALVLFVGLGVSSAFLSGCGDDEAAGQAQRGRPPALVRVAPLEKKIISRRVEVVGNVTPIRTSIVASGANGVVQYLSEAPPEENSDAPKKTPVSPGEPDALDQEIEVGQYVTKGTVLSVLRMEATNNELAEARALQKERMHKLKAVEKVHPKELAHADAMKNMAEAVKNNAKQKWERAKNLYDRGVANENEMEDAREKWKAAEQALIAAEQTKAQVEEGLDIEQAEAAFEAQTSHVAYLESEKAKRTTKAPFDGYITSVHTYKGQWLAKGDPVVTLAKMDQVDVMVNIDQADIPFVQLGQLAEVTVNGAPKRNWVGRIVHIVPESDWTKGSRGFPVVVRINNELTEKEKAQLGIDPDERNVPLKAGMLARVTIKGPPVETLLVPKDALVRTTRGTYIYIYSPKAAGAKLDPKKPTMGGVQQVQIEADLHMSDGELIGVRLAEQPSDGKNPLQPGAWVVTEGGERFTAPNQDNVNALSRLQEAKTESQPEE